MGVNLFHGKGSLSDEEIEEFLEHYNRYGRHNWDTRIHLGGDLECSKEELLINQATQLMGRGLDRLALTVKRLYEERSVDLKGEEKYSGVY